MNGADAVGDERGPAPGPAAEVEALRVGRRLVERENGEVGLEHLAMFVGAEFLLRERRPFLAEPFDSLRVNVPRERSCHEVVFRDGHGPWGVANPNPGLRCGRLRQVFQAEDLSATISTAIEGVPS